MLALSTNDHALLAVRRHNPYQSVWPRPRRWADLCVTYLSHRSVRLRITTFGDLYRPSISSRCCLRYDGPLKQECLLRGHDLHPPTNWTFSISSWWPVYRLNDRYWTSLSSQWPVLNLYFVSVTYTEPVYRLGDHFWPSISSWYHYWPGIPSHLSILNQYIISVNATDPVYRNSDQYWPSISYRWPVSTQYIITWPLMNQYIMFVTTTYPVYRLNDRYWPSISSQWSVLNQYIVALTSIEPVYCLGDHFWPSISSRYHYWHSISSQSPPLIFLSQFFTQNFQVINLNGCIGLLMNQYIITVASLTLDDVTYLQWRHFDPYKIVVSETILLKFEIYITLVIPLGGNGLAPQPSPQSFGHDIFAPGFLLTSSWWRHFYDVTTLIWSHGHEMTSLP